MLLVQAVCLPLYFYPPMSSCSSHQCSPLSLTPSVVPQGTIRQSDVRYGCEHWLITPKPSLSSLLLEVYFHTREISYSVCQFVLTATCDD
jgi:hypothetical protein